VGSKLGYPFLNQATQEEVAERLLSSLEAWPRASEHHRAGTPKRFVAALKEMTTREEFNFTTFPATSQNMVALAPIPFYSLCAHHVLPFHGTAAVGYVPDKRVAGLSKLARAVQQIAKGFHVQEELTEEIASFLESNLEPLGVAVQLRAEHLCMAMRGVAVAGSITTTATMTGVFAEHDRTAKAEFLEVIRG
jgi:GTP cyclohydrolase IA